ncbi:unnamed protein product [Paramecium octaurelia]|uniref:Cysteine-rich protein n=1 Tax=Paramecium octaurelia TaxID=43137 RepID=A0A8S1XNC6_PAROT|nr:unnamed protein product [Paramecium octaurelia]
MLQNSFSLIVQVIILQWKLSTCITCVSPIDCQSCQATYTLTKLGCVCKQNQYEESDQCYECPPLCKQCQRLTFCIDCLFSDFRELVNGQCVCFEGYYQVEGSSVCLKCNSFCKECFGATSNDCKVCSDIVGIQQIGSICKCADNAVYEEQSNSCTNCHSTCQTCFSKYINGCLTCDATLNRILKGLKCECSFGYYEDTNICLKCPLTEDNSLPQYYVLCEDNQLAWLQQVVILW